MSDMTRIEDKLEKIEGHIGTQAVTLERLTVSVEEHVRRTNLLESKVEPLEKHVSMMNGALRLISILGVVAAIAEAIVIATGHGTK